MKTTANRAVFAERARRTESLSFRLFYRLYKAAHLILTGEPVRVGNFSVLPATLLGRIVCVSDLWNHYAAAAFKARLPITTLPLARGHRLDGKSKMNFVSLAMHGLGAMSVYGDRIGVRLLVAASVRLCSPFLHPRRDARGPVRGWDTFFLTKYSIKKSLHQVWCG